MWKAGFDFIDCKPNFPYKQKGRTNYNVLFGKGVSHSRSYSASPTPTDEKAKRKRSFMQSFRNMSLLPRIGNTDSANTVFTGNISFLGQIYKTAKTRFSISKSMSLTSSSSQDCENRDKSSITNEVTQESEDEGPQDMP